MSPVSSNVNDAPPPLVSFALPVRNGERFLPRALESILAQDLADLEIVVCDNQSTDGTVEIGEEFARRDRRVRFIRNSENVGQIANFNRVLELARGTYFRWIGADDYLDPTYASQCVAALEADRDAIAATTYQAHIRDDGTIDYAEYQGQRLDSYQPHRRFGRMMWFFTADYRFIDPIYTMFRRQVLADSSRLRAVPHTDMVLSAELALLGRFIHVPKKLAYRRREPSDYDEHERLAREYHPQRPQDLAWSTLKMCQVFSSLVGEQRLTLWQKTRCRLAIARFVTTINLLSARRVTHAVARRVIPSGVRTWLKGKRAGSRMSSQSQESGA